MALRVLRISYNHNYDNKKQELSRLSEYNFNSATCYSKQCEAYSIRHNKLN